MRAFLPKCVGLICVSCSSGQEFAFRFLQTSPHDDALAVPLVVPVTKAHRGLSPLSYRALPGAHAESAGIRITSSFIQENYHFLVVGGANVPSARMDSRFLSGAP